MKSHDELRPHYDFDFSKMKRNRFAGMHLSVPIYLDDDVAEVFDSSEAVNTVSPLCHSRDAPRGRETVAQANSTQEARLVGHTAARCTKKQRPLFSGPALNPIAVGVSSAGYQPAGPRATSRRAAQAAGKLPAVPPPGWRRSTQIMTVIRSSRM
jgi:hypothetical protein